MVVGKDVDSKDQMVTRDQMTTGDNMDIKNEIEIQDEAEEDNVPTNVEPIICITCGTNKKVVEEKKVIIPKDALVDVKHRVSNFFATIGQYPDPVSACLDPGQQAASHTHQGRTLGDNKTGTSRQETQDKEEGGLFFKNVALILFICCLVEEKAVWRGQETPARASKGCSEGT